MTKNIGKYIDRYNIYQRMKNQTEILAGNLKLSTREAMNISDSRFYPKVAIDSNKECNLSSME